VLSISAPNAIIRLMQCAIVHGSIISNWWNCW